MGDFGINDEKITTQNNALGSAPTVACCNDDNYSFQQQPPSITLLVAVAVTVVVDIHPSIMGKKKRTQAFVSCETCTRANLHRSSSRGAGTASASLKMRRVG
jgi:hypothetical protein